MTTNHTTTTHFCGMGVIMGFDLMYFGNMDFSILESTFIFGLAYIYYGMMISNEMF